MTRLRELFRLLEVAKFGGGRPRSLKPRAAVGGKGGGGHGVRGGERGVEGGTDPGGARGPCVGAGMAPLRPFPSRLLQRR